MKVDVIASEPHYLDHLLPIYHALPPELQGHVHPLRRPTRPLFDNVALVAGFQDVDALRMTARHMIYVEHGAGQAYLGDEKLATLPAYSGGASRHPRNVIGYIAPSARVASRWNAPSAAVGCPKMDKWVGLAASVPTVCIAFHWDCRLGPETRSALPHYVEHLESVVASFHRQGFTVYGHGHPRWRGHLRQVFERAGVDRYLDTDAQVFEMAAVLVMDNSSLMYEFASLGRSVITMNAPWYRRDVEHGLRFWSAVPGLQVDNAAELSAVDLLSSWYRSDEVEHDLREAAVDEAYTFVDGTSSRRAAEFVTQLVGTL